MNYRLTIAAAVAVMLASCSEYLLISGAGWLFASIGAVVVIALAGTATRMAPTRAASCATVLAAAASVPLFTERSLWLKVAGVAIIACCAGSFTPARVFRLFADLVTYLAALLLYLNLTLSSGKSFGFLIPSPKSLHHLLTLAKNGTVVAKSAPPVGGTGVVLLAAASIGLAAVVVDIIAVRLHRPAIAGLPLLVIYLAPVATAAKPGGPGSILTFLLAASGYLALLASDGRARLRGWGRIVTVWHYSGEDDRIGGADIGGLAATGRRIGVAALCAAVVAPLVLPSLNLHHLFGGGGGHGKATTAILPNPVDQLHTLLSSSKPVPVLSYKSGGSDPGEYLQVYVLNYDSTRGIWNLIPPTPSITIGATALAAAPGVSVATTQTTTQVKLDNVSGAATGYNSSLFFLPVPYSPVALTANGSWSESVNTLMIYSGNAEHSGLGYSVTSSQPEVTTAAETSTASIPRSIRRSYLGFRSPVSPQLATIARQITAGAKTPFAKAKAMERYFQAPGNFTYTLNALNLPNSPRGLLDFLTKGKKGSCEQFAFAMAVLARLIGIPSRIAIGFTSGTEQRHGTWTVTTADAHAWPELYFPSLGWLRFEPTPGGSAGQGTAVQPTYATGTSSGGTNPGQSKNPGSITGPGGKGKRKGPTSRFRGPQSGQLGGGPAPITTASAPAPVGQILLGVLILLLLIAAAPAIGRAVAARRRWRTARGDAATARAAWREVCADLDDLGFRHPASETPRALARRLSSDIGLDEPGQAAIGRISVVVERTRYSLDPAATDGIRADVRVVRRSLARQAGFVARARARLFPASVIRPLMLRFGRYFGQLTGWVLTPTESG
jgi:transglutaminase-like putative cysteine protease